MPEKHNHWLFVTVVNLTILSAYVINPQEFFKKFKPFVCLELIILYFFAVFHKLNYDYFNPEISCGAFFYKTQATRFHFLPNSLILETVSIYATIFFEMLIPLLLISTKGRNLGILVALLFHGIIGFNPTSEFWNFSSVIYAILVLFTPEEFSKPYFEFQRYVQAHPEISVTYSRNNNSAEDTFPWYYKAFLVFRPVSKNTETPCTR